MMIVSRSTREKLLERQTQAKKVLAVRSHVDDERYKNYILPDIWDHSASIDNILMFHPTYKNVNILQDCACNGDVRSLEHAVAI